MSNLFVIDTNTLVSAFLFRYSNPRRAFDKATESGKVLASLATYDELRDVFLRPKFDKYVSLAERLLVLKEFRERTQFVETMETITDCRDAKDNKFLELAVAANASCIVTGDNDLLVLNPFRGIPIMNASGFLNNF